jgi:DNA-binding NtrC family response regulator
VRQLRNTIEGLVITCKSETIDAGDLPAFLVTHDRDTTVFAIRPGMTLAEVDKWLIRLTLTHATSNRGEAAKLLGISRRALQYKLKEYGLLQREDWVGAETRASAADPA